MTAKPYTPKAPIDRRAPDDAIEQAQRDSDAYYARAGITQKVVLEPKGYVWKFYRHGVEIPGGLQFI